MPITSLTIKGLRGFSTEQCLRVARPSGETGSGLTILVGPNNGGKSTVIESLQALVDSSPTFSEGKRNKEAGDKVSIAIKDESGDTYELRTVDSGGSEVSPKPQRLPNSLYVLPSRRHFDPYFGGKSQANRREYERISRFQGSRGQPLHSFSNRLFKVLETGSFDSTFRSTMEQVVGFPFDWTIDQTDQGQYYLKFEASGTHHSSDGLGEGLVSLLFIVDALYDAPDGGAIVIDEPELSLHPAYQRRLAQLLAEEAKSKQIIYATHSPYFVDFEHILNGAEIARVHKREGDGSIISQPCRQTVEELGGFLRNLYNPHILGIGARETFFQDDGVVVVEGQDDVVLYRRVLDQLAQRCLLSSECGSDLKERFFGWGAGGAANIERIVALLKDLGFDRVAAIFDKNEAGRITELKGKFPKCYFGSTLADDIRSKEGAGPGLLDENYELLPEFVEETAKLFREICRKVGVHWSSAAVRIAEQTVSPNSDDRLTGEVVFDYSRDESHFIGDGQWEREFETRWSKANNRSIHVYSDPISIDGVAIAKGSQSIAEVVNAESLDYTSRTQTPLRGEIVVFRNVHGFYAAVQVLNIKDDTRGDERDELRFRYAIQSNGSDSFAEFDEDLWEGFEAPLVSLRDI